MEGPGLRAGDALLILALETSCDETAAALLDGGRIVSNVVSSQADLHARFGGVVPEIASRRHLELVVPVVQEALGEHTIDDVDSVAVTQGPGLIGALLVGLSAAKALAWGRGLPLVPVNHLHGHVASLYLEPEPFEPPFLCLLASGGHTLLVDVPEHGAFRPLGTTLDDAAGEAFDKGARLLGLGYPGGAEIDRLAREGDPEAFAFPVARVPGLDFRSRESRRRFCTRCAGSVTRSRSGGQISPRATSGRSCRRSSGGRSRQPSRPGPSGSPSSAAWPPTRSFDRLSRKPRRHRSRSAPTTPR